MKGHAAKNSRLVIVALDGSPAAATALPLALAVAEQLGTRAQVLHASAVHIPEVELRAQLGLDSDELASIEVMLDIGDRPAGSILHATDDQGIQVVVMTTHGRTIEPGRQLGRVATEVIARTTEPVILVRPEAPSSRGPLKRLLLPLDGTPTTTYALTPATDLACELGASVDILYVATQPSAATEPGSMGVPQYIDQAHHEWPSWATEVVDRLYACAGMAPEIPVRVFLGQGDVGSEISRFAQEYKHDAVILVRRSHLEPDRARILRAVLDSTSCPILLVGSPD